VVLLWHTIICALPACLWQMGAAPSTQDDLLCLKSSAATPDQRKKAFQRLRAKLVPALPEGELHRIVADVKHQSYPTWPQPPVEASFLSREALTDRVRGCIFGAALGDSAGLATEFLTKEQSLTHYDRDADFAPGSDVYPDEHRMMWCAGDWTDDTDQHIVLLQSLLHTEGRAEPRDFAARLARWHDAGFPELGDQSGGGLGQTTKAVLNDKRFLDDPHTAAAAHSSKKPTNGGVMRTAIVGAAHFWDEEIVVANAVSLCKVTHADPKSIASCVAVAVAVSRLLRGLDITSHDRQVGPSEDNASDAIGNNVLERAVVAPALACADAFLRDAGTSGASGDLAAYTRVAQTLEELALDEPRTIGYTFKCLGAGMWALRSDLSFRQALNALIQEAGDADTNGAVAGALLGCRLGFSRLPEDWIKGMPYHSWLEAHVQKLLLTLGL